GAVGAERAAAERPGDERERHAAEHERPVGVRYREQRQRREDGSEQEGALVRTRSRAAAEQGDEGGPDADEPADEGHTADERTRLRHPPDRDIAALDAAEAPVLLRHD